MDELSNLLQSHPDDVFVPHQFMKGLVAPCKTGAVPLSVMAAQHPMFRQTAWVYADNPLLQAEYTQFLYFLAERACAENQLEQVNLCIEELKELAVRYPGHEEIANWNVRALARRAQCLAGDPEFSPELEQTLVEEFRQATMQPAVTLKLAKRKTTAYSSKVGGTPYLPAGFAYPHRGGTSRCPCWPSSISRSCYTCPATRKRASSSSTSMAQPTSFTERTWTT